jgi:hypothetical protein
MGFNPFRPTRKEPIDFLVVGVTIVIVVGLVVWAIWG